MLELTSKHRLSADEGADIKRALLDSVRSGGFFAAPEVAANLIAAFELVDRSTAEPIPSVR